MLQICGDERSDFVESFNVVVVSFAKRRNNESLVQIYSAIDVCRTTESQTIVHGIARLVFEGTPVEPMATHESDRRNCLRNGVGDQNRAGKTDRQRQDAVAESPFNDHRVRSAVRAASHSSWETTR